MMNNRSCGCQRPTRPIETACSSQTSCNCENVLPCQSPIMPRQAIPNCNNATEQECSLENRCTSTNKPNSCGCHNNASTNRPNPCGCQNMTTPTASTCCDCKCNCQHPIFPSPIDSPCPCNMENDCLKGMPLAMAYVPWQPWQDVANGCNGLNQGTIFNDLVLPFHCEDCKGERRCNCR